MEFEKFKKHINTIQQTMENERKVSNCIQEYLSTGTYCIVDISANVIKSVIELLADYYNCHFEDTTNLSDDISWWLFEDVDKKITKNVNGKEVIYDVNKLEDFWKYLEHSKNNSD